MMRNIFLASTVIAGLLPGCQTAQQPSELGELRQQFISKSLSRPDRQATCKEKAIAVGIPSAQTEDFCKCIIVSMAEHLSDDGVRLISKMEFGPGSLTDLEEKKLMSELSTYESFRISSCGY